MANLLKKKFIGADQVDGEKILLLNGQSLRKLDGAGVEYDVISDLEGQVDSEESRAMAAEGVLDGKITTEKERIDAILLAADADKDSFAEIVQLINSVDTDNDTAFGAYVISNNAALADEVSARTAADSAIVGDLNVFMDEVTDYRALTDGRLETAESDIDSLESSKVNKAGDLEMSGTFRVSSEAPGVMTEFDGSSFRASWSEGETLKTASAITEVGVMLQDHQNSEGSQYLEVTPTYIEKTGLGNGFLLNHQEIKASASTSYASLQNSGAYVGQNLGRSKGDDVIDEFSVMAGSEVIARVAKYVQDNFEGTFEFKAEPGYEYPGYSFDAGLGDGKQMVTPTMPYHFTPYGMFNTFVSDTSTSLDDITTYRGITDERLGTVESGLSQEILDRQAAITETMGWITAEEVRASAAEAVLQSNIDVEKGRIDAILLASDADKDSFAEIVQLINSVDTANDSAFGAYVISNNLALQNEVNARTQADSDLDSRVGVLELGAVALDGRLGTAESDIDLLQSQVAGLGAVSWVDEKFVVDAAMITAGSVTLSHTPISKSVVAFVDRLGIFEGESEDFTMSGAVLTFKGQLMPLGAQALQAGDEIRVKYQK